MGPDTFTRKNGFGPGNKNLRSLEAKTGTAACDYNSIHIDFLFIEKY